MKIYRQKLDLKSKSQIEFIDITEKIREVIERSAIRDGQVLIFSPHTTAGVVINHNEPMLIQDFMRVLYRIAPVSDRYSHDLFELNRTNISDGRSNGHSHCKTIFLGNSQCVPIEKGKMMLSEKQSVFFAETDGARKRDLSFKLWVFNKLRFFVIMNSLINNLIKEGYLKTDLIIDAFSEIGRVEFMPKDLEKEALADMAFPIGYGQTISQPKTVAIMFELLDPQRGNNILDVGSGSGWTTALFCYIVGRHGRVTALERIEGLMEWGKKNVAKYNYLKNEEKGVAEFYSVDGYQGFLKNAPYDRILVSASCNTVPEELKKQLKVGGKMVLPIKDSLVYLEKKSENDFYEEKYPGFSFVPMI
jgi:protein-L-isoaspartate(D-aspartate) O-methyltransferase